MKYNRNIDSFQVLEIENPMNIRTFLHIKPLENYITKKRFIHFAVHVCYLKMYILYIKHNLSTTSLSDFVCVITLLYGFSDLLDLIHETQKSNISQTQAPYPKTNTQNM